VNRRPVTIRACLTLLMLATAARAAPPEPRPYHVSRYDVTLEPDLAQHLIRGLATLDIVAAEDNLSAVELDASEMMVLACGQGRRRFHYIRTNDLLRVDLPRALKTNQGIRITIRYEATPQTGVRFSNDQVYSVFSTSHWLPCNDRPSDRAVFTIHVTAPPSLAVVASGEFVSARTTKGETTSTWRVQHPIPTYVAGFAVGRFTTRSDGAKAGGGDGLRTVAYLISPDFQQLSPDSQHAAAPHAGEEPAAKAESPSPPSNTPSLEEGIFSITRAAAAFFASKAGKAYPGKTYTEVFTSTDVAQEADQFTLLSQSYFADLTSHPDNTWLLAHELAHQWWGISVTCEDWSDFWLNEGISTYMADAFLEKQYGKARYDKEIERSHQVYREALINGQDRPLSYHEWTRPQQAGGPLPYHKGAWFLHLLRQQIGDDQFWLGMRQYTSGNWQKSVVSHTFQTFFEDACRCKLQNLFNQYVY
jgi:aminopeptidase N